MVKHEYLNWMAKNTPSQWCNDSALTNDLEAAPAETEGVTVDAPAGSIVAFSSLLLHATGANRSDAPRRVYLAQYSPEAILNPGTRQLRRNAIALVQDGRQVTFP